MSDDRAPFTVADIDVLAIGDSTIPRRKRRNVRAELTKPTAIAIKTSLFKTRATVEHNCVIWDVRRAIRCHNLAHVEVTTTHPQLTTPLLTDPTGIAGVVIMKMSGDHTRDRFAIEMVLKNATPVTLRMLSE